METKIINSVGRYLETLDKVINVNNDYFYRGESQDFGDTKLTATLYRKSLRNKNQKIMKRCFKRFNGVYHYYTVFKYNTWRTYLDAAQDFYKNVPHLSNNEKQNFMALCQHHGLPTPLLDVSTSALVALYFASQDFDNKSGRVYVFKKDNFILYDNKILSYEYLSKCRRTNLSYGLLSMKTNDDIRDSLKSIRDFEINGNKNQNKYFGSLINSIIRELIFGKFRVRKDSYCSNILKDLKQYSSYFRLYKGIANTNNGIFSNRPILIAKCYIHFLRLIFGIRSTPYSFLKSGNGIKMVRYHYVDKNNRALGVDKLVNYSLLLLFLIYIGNYMSGTAKLFVPKELNFYTNCTLNWGRIKAQKSHFIIQTPYISDGKNFNNFLSKTDSPNNDSVQIFNKSIVHKPKPFYVFKIKNKRRIRKQLDTMGINEMNLFMDKDSVADYLRNKYYV